MLSVWAPRTQPHSVALHCWLRAEELPQRYLPETLTPANIKRSEYPMCMLCPRGCIWSQPSSVSWMVRACSPQLVAVGAPVTSAPNHQCHALQHTLNLDLAPVVQASAAAACSSHRSSS